MKVFPFFLEFQLNSIFPPAKIVYFWKTVQWKSFTVHLSVLKISSLGLIFDSKGRCLMRLKTIWGLSKIKYFQWTRKRVAHFLKVIYHSNLANLYVLAWLNHFVSFNSFFLFSPQTLPEERTCWFLEALLLSLVLSDTFQLWSQN